MRERFMLGLDQENGVLYWIAASHLMGVRTRMLHHWLAAKGDYQSLFSSSRNHLEHEGFTAVEIEQIKNIPWDRIESEQQSCANKAEILTLHDVRYPPLLKEISDPPLVLYVAGDATLLSLPQLAMVGSRHPSSFGLEKASQFAKTLSDKGLIITSGLALGIDGACHQGALSGSGKTIAVMGTGLGRIYPQAHYNLAEQIKQHGAIVSEFPWNTPPSPWNFPRRNRIISGLSVGVLVVEAALGSGSLITARCAVEQNREVFAMPGSIHHPLARGCHQLIRQGAKLVESAQDIIEELTSFIDFFKESDKIPEPQASLHDLEETQRKLLNHIDYAATAMDVIQTRSRLTASQVSSILLFLELKGYIEAVQGGYMRIS